MLELESNYEAKRRAERAALTETARNEAIRQRAQHTAAAMLAPPAHEHVTMWTDTHGRARYTTRRRAALVTS